MRTIDDIAVLLPALYADLKTALGYVIVGHDELEATMEHIDKAIGFLNVAIRLVDEDEQSRPEEVTLYGKIVAAARARAA